MIWTKKNRTGEMGSELQNREQIVVLNKIDSLGFPEREKMERSGGGRPGLPETSMF